MTFSQGLSPNAQIALRQSESYAHSVLFTAVDMAAVGPAGAPRLRQSLLGAVRGIVVPHLPAQESGTLLRLIGPMCATLMALRFAERLLQIRRGYAPFWAPDLARVPERYRECSVPSSEIAPLKRVKVGACLAVGFDAELARSLMWKWQEALYTPLPPAVDVLAFAHGPLQALYDSECMIVTLGRAGDEAADDLWSRLKKSLHPERHQVVELHAELPGPLSLFEFDAGMNAILLGEMRSRGIDPGRWPGQSTDEPLYSISRASGGSPTGNTSEDKKA